MRVWQELVVIAALGGGAWWYWQCRNDDDKPAASPRRPAAEPARADEPDEPDDLAAGEGYDDLLPRGPVRVPGPLAKLPLDGTVEEARRAAPELFTGEREITSPRWPGVRFFADLTVDRDDRPIEYHGPSMILPGDDRRDVLTRAWGPGADTVGAFDHPVVLWWNPDQGIRAELDEHYVRFRRYLPVAKLLGPGPDLAILTAPIVGRTPDEVMAAYGDRAERKFDLPELRLPPTEWELRWDRTVNGTATVDGKVLEYSVRLAYPTPAVRDELLALFRKKWGTDGEPVAGEGLRFVPGPIEILARDDEDAWTLIVRDRALADELRAIVR
jgi:hypothetical protein